MVLRCECFSNEVVCQQLHVNTDFLKSECQQMSGQKNSIPVIFALQELTISTHIFVIYGSIIQLHCLN